MNIVRQAEKHGIEKFVVTNFFTAETEGESSMLMVYGSTKGEKSVEMCPQ